MVKATFDVLSELDKQLVLETESKKLKALDEDALIDLHTRVRRARNRHTKVYRRGAAAIVVEDGARGMASKKSRRAAARAEVMEDALSKVSRQLAQTAQEAAEALRTERLATARGSKSPGKSSGKSSGKSGKAKPGKSSGGKSSGGGSTKSSKVTPASKKARAGAKASGKRKQAKRDAT
ncbi:MAG: hypothetical protein WBA45_17545 [Microthrixaceae bacterium]